MATFKRLSLWLVILATVHTAIPASAQSQQNADRKTVTFQSEIPPAPYTTDGSRNSKKKLSATNNSSVSRLRLTASFGHWLLIFALALPCFAFSHRDQSAAAGEGRLAQPALFRDDGVRDVFPLELINHEAVEAESRYQAGPPPLADNWLRVGGKIPIAAIEEYPRIPALDRQGGLFDTWRPNLLGVEVPVEWDFQNLINTDRPDFTDATFTVGEGVALLETGYTFRKSDAEELLLRRQQLPESLLRVGVTDELELRMKWNGHITTDIIDTTTNLHTTSVGGDDLQLGVKYEILQQDGWRPMLTFVGGAVIPTGTRGVSVNQVQPNAQFVFGWGIRRWLYLKGSTGVDFAKTADVTRVIEGSLQEGPLVIEEEDNISQWHQSLSLLFQVSPRVGGFAEWFSFFSNNAADNRASHYLDTGLYYYLTPNVQLDVRVGQQVSDRIDTLFTGAGFSTRW